MILSENGPKETLPWAELPQVLRQRLALEGIRSPEAWLGWSRKRRNSIFGLPPHLVSLIDLAARSSIGRRCDGCEE